MRKQKDQPYLHDAMQQVLRERPDKTATQIELAEIINRRQLYQRKDGAEVPSSQIGARAKQKPALFEKIPRNHATDDLAKIRLR